MSGPTTAGILGGSLLEKERKVWSLSSQDPALMRNLYSAFGSSLCQVPLLLHQKQALAWLLWRESQKPHGGILGESGVMIGANIHILFHLVLSAALE